MNREEVDKLKEGRETDRLIQERLYGGVFVKVPMYSRRNQHAISALEKMHQYTIEKLPNGTYFVKTWVNDFAGARVGEAKTLALAACRSILLWND